MKKKYTDEELKEDALKYTSRNEWNLNSKSKYSVACRRKLLDVCCAHMRYVENAYIDDIGIIYAYIFNDMSVYIGLTIKPKDRHHHHTTFAGPVFDKIQAGYTYKYLILEDKIPNHDLSDKEIYYIAKHRNEGIFTVLNKGKGGGRGSRRRVSRNPYIKGSQQSPLVAHHDQNSHE